MLNNKIEKKINFKKNNIEKKPESIQANLTNLQPMIWDQDKKNRLKKHQKILELNQLNLSNLYLGWSRRKKIITKFNG
jgi:hypothetical protein